MDARRATQELFTNLRPVGRPKTSIYDRSEQLRRAAKSYRLRKKQMNNIDDASSILKA